VAEEAALYALLSGVAGRVYPQVLPQGATLPAVVYTRIGGGGDYALAGEVSARRSTWQISVWASTYSAALSLAASVRSTLTAYTGTSAGTSIDHISIDDESDLYAAPNQIDVARRYGRRIDVTLWTQA